MTKNELIEELQKVEGNPQISIAIDRSWGKESYSAIIEQGLNPVFVVSKVTV